MGESESYQIAGRTSNTNQYDDLTDNEVEKEINKVLGTPKNDDDQIYKTITEHSKDDTVIAKDMSEHRSASKEESKMNEIA